MLFLGSGFVHSEEPTAHSSNQPVTEMTSTPSSNQTDANVSSSDQTNARLGEQNGGGQSGEATSMNSSNESKFNYYPDSNSESFQLINQLSGSNAEFAIDLYKRLSQEKGGENLFFSPYSLSTAFAMTYAGAAGETASQIAKVLHFRNEVTETFHSAFSHLQNSVNSTSNGNLLLNVANALWGHEKYPFRDEFKTLLKSYYNLTPNQVNFETDAEKARADINAWVKKQTFDKIQELIKPGILVTTTRLVLVNAIYFKGKWMKPFEVEQTKTAPFWVTANEKIDVPMMNQNAMFNYLEVPEHQVKILELPYAYDKQQKLPQGGSNSLSMIIILPSQRDGLAQLEKTLLMTTINEWLNDFHSTTVEVSLPRFKLEQSFELASTLQAMGMNDAFSEKADFSNMDNTKNLYIKSAIHQALIEVNEEGTEAAAATAIFAVTRGMPMPPKQFVADHPFIFLIRHNATGSILFMGRVVKLSP
jgi:serpin B